MEHDIVEEKIKQKELAIVDKIDQLKGNEEIWESLMKGSCFRCVCGVQRNAELAKAELHDIMSYLIHIDKIVLEKLKKETLSELWELLSLYLDKREIYQSVKI